MAELAELRLSIEIDASQDRIWHCLLADETYRIWTSAFFDGSYFVGDWTVGSRMKFLAGVAAECGGLISLVKEHVHGRKLALEHVGTVSQGMEVEEAWGTIEEYHLHGDSQPYTLEIVQTLEAAHLPMFQGMWEKALAILKDLAEAKD